MKKDTISLLQCKSRKKKCRFKDLHRRGMIQNFEIIPYSCHTPISAQRKSNSIDFEATRMMPL